MLTRVWKAVRRFFSREPGLLAMTCRHACKYEDYYIFIMHFRQDDDRFIPHVTDHVEEDDTPGDSVFEDSGCYDTCRAAYLAAKMQIDERCGYGVEH